jgi:hypothetical protein
MNGVVEYTLARSIVIEPAGVWSIASPFIVATLLSLRDPMQPANLSPSIGESFTPTIASPSLFTNPTSVQYILLPVANDFVPSIGSSTQQYSGCSQLRADGISTPCSSP